MPAEREAAARAVVMQTMTFGYGPDSDYPLGSAQWERSVALTTASNAAELDAYRAAVAETVRAEGAGEAVAQRGENPCGCVAERVTAPVIKYVEVCENHFSKLEGMRLVGPDSPEVFRATPPLAPDTYARGRADTLAEVRAVVEGLPPVVLTGEETRVNGITILAHRTTLDDTVQRFAILGALDTLAATPEAK